MSARFGVAGCILIAALALSGPTRAAPCWSPPVLGSIVDPFREPECPYCAGNRGIEYSIGAFAQVTAVASGTVAWSGTIAGTRYVVVRHRDGWRTTYGMLVSTTLRTGDEVSRGASIGVAATSFHFGLRVAEVYTDPAPFFGQLVGRPRLVPSDAQVARPAPPPAIRCAAPS